MRNRCLDEGLLQSYIDGELSQEQAAETAAHIAACESCAEALATAADENSFFAAAFAPDDSLSVPTELLRSRLGAAVAQLEESQGSNGKRSGGFNFNGFLASLSSLFTFTPQRAAAFASLLILVAAGIIYFAVIRPRGTNDARRGPQEIASRETTPERPEAVAPKSEASNGASNDNGSNSAGVPAAGKESGKSPFVSAGYKPRRPVSRPEVKPTPAPETKKQELLPGETAYQTAIASLEKTIQIGGDVTLKPAVRVQYERNLAILDNAIVKTREVAAKNPKDKDAVGFLMSAYQSKVELLTQVADQAQVAALGR